MGQLSFPWDGLSWPLQAGRKREWVEFDGILCPVVWPLVGVRAAFSGTPQRQRFAGSWPMAKPVATKDSENRPGEAASWRPPLDCLHLSPLAPSEDGATRIGMRESRY